MTGLQMMRELIGETCRCGNGKRAHHSFCGSCYFKLSTEQRRAIHLRLGRGYEEAYRQALEVLGFAPQAETAAER